MVDILVGSFYFYAKKLGIKKETDYRTIFIMGVIWTVIGIIPENYFFLIMGIAFMIIGLINKKKWKKPKPWNKLSANEKKYKKFIMITIGVLFLILLVLILIITR